MKGGAQYAPRCDLEALPPPTGNQASMKGGADTHRDFHPKRGTRNARGNPSMKGGAMGTASWRAMGRLYGTSGGDGGALHSAAFGGVVAAEFVDGEADDALDAAGGQPGPGPWEVSRSPRRVWRL